MLKQKEVKFNGFFMWTRDKTGRLIAVRQLEPTDGWRDEKDRLDYPIEVGIEGSIGRDITEILNENETLKKRVLELEQLTENYATRELEDINKRLTKLERPWWRF